MSPARRPSSFFEKILLGIGAGALVATLFAPIITNNFFFFPFIAPRAFVFQMSASVLFGAALLLFLFFPERRPRATLLTPALLAYFVAAGLATLASADPGKSFIGSVERSYGFYHMLHFGMVFFGAVMFLQSEKAWRRLLWTSLSISLYPSLDFLLPFFTQEKPPITSIMGNPTFLAPYLSFHIFFALFLAESKEYQHKRAIRVLLWIITAVHLAAVLATGVRGAFVGLVAASFYLGLLGAWKRREWRMPLVGVLLIGIAAYSLVFINRDVDFMKKNHIVSKITNFSLQDATIQSRFSMWKMAYQGFKERPFLGWGKENFSLVFNVYYDSSFNDVKVAEGWEDRTHNIFFDQLIDGGILGLVVYLGLLAAAFYCARRNPLAVAILIAYVVQNFFGVESLNASLPFFLFLALYDFQHRKAEESAVAVRTPVIPLVLQKQSIKVFLGSLGLGAMAFLTYCYTFLPASGNHAMILAYTQVAANNPQAFEIFYRRGLDELKHVPYQQTEILALLIQALGQYTQAFGKNELTTKVAETYTIDFSERAFRTPSEERFPFIFAQFFMQRALFEKNPNLLDRADEILNTLIAGHPTRKIFLAAAQNSQKIRAWLIQEATKP